jgi:hypothetical protein
MSEDIFENLQEQMAELRRVCYVWALNYAFRRERHAHRYQRIWKRAHRH